MFFICWPGAAGQRDTPTWLNFRDVYADDTLYGTSIEATRYMVTHLARKLAGKVLDAPARVLGSIFGNGKSSAEYRDHKRASSHLEHGRRHYNKKNYEKAEDYLRRAVTEDAGYALAHYYLGLALYKQNLSDKAIGSWRRATKAEPGSDAASKAERKLEYVRKHMNQVIDELESQIRKE